MGEKPGSPGVSALSWLIFADSKRIIRTEGFVLSELESKIKEITP